MERERSERRRREEAEEERSERGRRREDPPEEESRSSRRRFEEPPPQEPPSREKRRWDDDRARSPRGDERREERARSPREERREDRRDERRSSPGRTSRFSAQYVFYSKIYCECKATSITCLNVGHRLLANQGLHLEFQLPPTPTLSRSPQGAAAVAVVLLACLPLLADMSRHLPTWFRLVQASRNFDHN